MKVKRLCAILFLAILCSYLFSCTPNSSETGQTTTADTSTAGTDKTYIPDDLPDDLGFDNTELTWLVGDYASAYWSDFYSETMTGDRVSDAIRQTKIKVEERLQVKINMIRNQFVYDTRQQYFNMVQNSFLSASGDFDIISGIGIGHMILQGDYLHNLADNTYIDLGKPWWNQSINDMMSDGSVYMTTGDGTLSGLKYTYAVFFNQDLLEDFNKDVDLYQLVKSGTWTLDQMLMIIENTYQDLNGNSTPDYGDVFGVSFADSNTYTGFMKGSGINIIEVTADENRPYVLTYGNELVTTVTQKLQAFINANENVYAAGLPSSEAYHDVGDGTLTSRSFADGSAVFTFGRLNDAATLLADADFQYGILPYPKFSETQARYGTGVQRCAFFHIPADCKDEDMSGAVLEAWSSECYRSVVPEYFELMLKVRYSSGTQMAEMFDIIHDSVQFDFGEIFADALSSPAVQFKLSLSKSSDSWTVRYGTYRDVWEQKLLELTNKLKNNS